MRHSKKTDGGDNYGYSDALDNVRMSSVHASRTVHRRNIQRLTCQTLLSPSQQLKLCNRATSDHMLI